MQILRYTTLLIILVFSIQCCFSQEQIPLNTTQQDNAVLSVLYRIPLFKDSPIKFVDLKSFEKKEVQEGLSVSWGSLSPDGARIITMLTKASQPLFGRFGTINLRTQTFWEMSPPGETGKTNNDIQLYPGAWDVADPAYLYINYFRTTTHADTQKTIIELWRVRYDGTNGKLLSAPDEDTVIEGITPDGHWLLVRIIHHATDNPAVDISSDRYFQATDNPIKRKPIDWPDDFKKGWADYSPNGNFLLRLMPDNNGMLTLQCCDLTSKRIAPIFSVAQVKIRVPTMFRPSVGKIPQVVSYHWLSDSSGCLVNLMMDENVHELWFVTIDGQAQRLSDKLKLITSSQNGRYFLFRVNDRYYLMSIPHTH